MINNTFNIYDEINNIPSTNENYNVQYDMRFFDKLLDGMIQKKEKNIEYCSDEIEIM